jgi:CHASE2 domain-containing sensor protein
VRPLYRLYIYGVLILSTVFSIAAFTEGVAIPYLGPLAGLIVAVVNITGIVVFRWLNERNK